MQEKYSDVTLACEGHFYKVHRLVLSICSDYFDAILEQTPCKHPVLVLNNIKAEDLDSLLQYIYDGKVSVPEANLTRFLKAAGQLTVKGLSGLKGNNDTEPSDITGDTQATIPLENIAVVFFVVLSLSEFFLPYFAVYFFKILHIFHSCSCNWVKLYVCYILLNFYRKLQRWQR